MSGPEQTSGATPGAGDPRRLPVVPVSAAQVGRAVESLPGLARLATRAAVNTAEWGALTGWRTARRLAVATRDPEAAADLARELGIAVGVVVELGRQLSNGAALPTVLVELGRAITEDAARTDDDEDARASLRRRGEELLVRSRDVWDAGEAHPAYERILGELAPDEARILVFLHRAGPQPSVDVRTGGPIGVVSSRLVAPGLTMIGARAGVRYGDDVPAYLNNLFRLGLVWFSRETLRDPGPYQVLEAQPDVLAAVHSVKLAKVIRRSIALTPFGRDFCAMVLASEEAVGGSEVPPGEEA